MPRLQLKRARVAYPCRVCTRECMLEQEGIQCDGCECWLHQQCVGMTTTQYVHFSQPHLQFFCRQCVGNNAAFNFSSSLSRISVLSPDLAAMKLQADSEQNLLQFYNVLLPQVSTVSTVDVVPHKQSELLLRDKSPWILDQYVPADVAGDGVFWSNGHDVPTNMERFWSYCAQCCVFFRLSSCALACNESVQLVCVSYNRLLTVLMSGVWSFYAFNMNSVCVHNVVYIMLFWTCMLNLLHFISAYVVFVVQNMTI